MRCEIEYSYYTGGGFNKQNHTVTTTIGEGEAKSINQSNMNHVQNLDDLPVTFVLSGAFDVTLNKDQRNPLVGPYLQPQPVTLVKAICEGAGSASSQVLTPAILVNTMQAADATSAAIASALSNQLSLTIPQIAGAMKNSGFGVGDVAKALKQGLGAGAKPVMAAIKAVYGVSDDVAAAALKTAGFGMKVIMAALKEVYSSPVGRIVPLLKGLGYKAQDIARGLREVFGLSASQARKVILKVFKFSIKVQAKILKEAGFGLGEIISALRVSIGELSSALKYAGYSALEVAKAFKTNLRLTRDEAIRAFSGSGFSKADINRAIARVYGLDVRK